MKEREGACVRVEEGSDIKREWNGHGTGRIVVVKGEIRKTSVLEIRNSRKKGRGLRKRKTRERHKRE